MSKYLWSAALCLAWSGSALSQTQADFEYEQKVLEEDKLSYERLDENGEPLIIHWSEPSFDNDTIFVVGTRFGTSRTDDQTAAISLITEGEIEARAQAHVSDLLRSLPGISVSNSGPATGLSQIRLRGSEANQVLVIIDGVEVSNPTDGGFDFASLRTEDVVRVEVLRGEQSALWGADAVGGVINIITRAGETSEGWSASLEAGSRDTLEGQISAHLPIGGATLSVNGNAFRTDGYDVSGLGGEEDGARSRSLNLGLNNVELGGLTLSAKYGGLQLRSEFDNDSPFDGRLDNTNDETIFDQRTARIDGRFELGGFSNLIALSYLTSETDTRGGFASISEGERTKLSYVTERTFADLHTLILLAEGEREKYDIIPSFAASPDSPENETGGIAADYRFDNDVITLNFSARHDFNDRFEDATTWRVGAGYAFDWDGRVLASIGTGVKNPTLVELFGFYPESDFVGNPDLEPETSFGWSIGYDQTIGNGSVSIDYFQSELEDEIFTDFATVPNLPRNRAFDSERQGVEVEGRYRIGSVNLRGSVTWLDSEENGVEEIRRPEWTGSASIDWQATDALGLGLFVDHTGSQLDTDFALFAPIELDAYTLVSANIRYEVSDHVTLTVRGENLLNKDYQEIVSYASPGRAIYAGVGLNF